MLNTILNNRTDLHISRLHDKITWGNATAVDTLNTLMQRFQGTSDASLMALKQLNQIVHRQAVVMGFADAFFMMTVFFIGLSTLVIFVDRPRPMGAAADAH